MASIFDQVQPTGNPVRKFAMMRRQPVIERTMRETSHPSLNAFGNFVVAGSAAVPARLAVHPFSVIRICAQAGVPGHKTGPSQSAIWIWRIEGLRAYLKALPPSVAKSFPQIGLQFGIFDALAKKYVPQIPHNKPSVLASAAIFVSGGIAGSVAQSILHPIDVIKTRLCVQGILTEPVYKGTLACAKKILANDGVLGLYRGFIPSVAGAYVFSAYMFAGWDFMNRLPWRRNNVNLYWFENYIDPLLVVMAATLVSTPFDVIRRKMMAYDPTLPKQGRVDVVADNFYNTVVNTYKDAGFPGFFRGYFASSLKVVPQLVIFYLAFKAYQKPIVAALGTNEQKAAKSKS